MLEPYSYTISGDRKKFDFTSAGPKGRIPKLIEFSPVHEQIHQLGLTDRLANGESDLTLPPTNNGDVYRVMSTVIESMVCFFNEHPDQWVWIKGASAKHRRLYHRFLTTQLPAKNSHYLFYGIQSDQTWDAYQPGIDYESILVAKRLTPVE
ncbi:hypothetical protein LX87_04509 [Larkinella arboricola]|uniref:Uncharacterized protein n=1 Tax=Larkinella arboricola TaxID=643671 RepID=A0A327WQ10_LARAB|nr:hypothetical protein [Larkinella arboricola]RAJ92997.1 hypothetical protein LX87_04509 [Larkinella arboricola]